MVLKDSKEILSSHDVLKTLPGNHRKDRGRRRNGGQRRRTFIPVLMTLAMLGALVLGADYWINFGKIYWGVSVGSVDLGGKTPEEARKILEEHTEELKEIKLTTGTQEFIVSSKDAGVDFEVPASVDHAYRSRRGRLRASSTTR